MALSPALTCCTAWLPVSAPSACTYSSVFSKVQSRSAPRRASVCSSCTEPRSRTTSAAVKVRSVPSHRASAQFCCRSVTCRSKPVLPESVPCPSELASRRRVFTGPPDACRPRVLDTASPGAGPHGTCCNRENQRIFVYFEHVTTFAEKEFASLPNGGLDLVLFGQRLRH